jgi:hypothetical protein
MSGEELAGSEDRYNTSIGSSEQVAALLQLAISYRMWSAHPAKFP